VEKPWTGNSDFKKWYKMDERKLDWTVEKKNGIHYKIKSLFTLVILPLGYDKWNSFYEDIYKRDDELASLLFIK
jgi:hypothetical protein